MDKHEDRCRYWSDGQCDCWVAEAKETEKWKARFNWLINQWWVQEEAEFRLGLRETETGDEFHAVIIEEIDDQLTGKAG